MNVVEAVRYYIQKIVGDPGMKVLLMDDDTVRFFFTVKSMFLFLSC